MVIWYAGDASFSLGFFVARIENVKGCSQIPDWRAGRRLNLQYVPFMRRTYI